jgi:Right handed beta helix region
LSVPAKWLARVALLTGLGLALAPVAAPASPDTAGSDIRVPDDVPTLQLAIGRAAPGDTIVLAAGTYPGGNVVPREKHDITIRGVDRNEVVLDGADRRRNGIVVHADGVSVLNLSAHNFLQNALYWEAADRFRASYVTVWNVGGYGIYAEDAEQGVLDNDYVSGAGDAAYYVGECRPCRATLSRVVATLSAVGYSGTNATGVVIRDSLWDRNGAGIVPNTYANEALPPQSRTTIVRNTVTNSGRARVPIQTALAGFVGIGIAVAGGNQNAIGRNRVTRSERYGIAVFPTARFVVFDPGTPEPRPPWRPRGNRVFENVVSGSGRADLALAKGSGKGNCFIANAAGRALPRGLQTPTCVRVSPAGDASVASELTRPVRVMLERTRRRRHPPSYTSMPMPAPQPSMPIGSSAASR